MRFHTARRTVGDDPGKLHSPGCDSSPRSLDDPNAHNTPIKKSRTPTSRRGYCPARPMSRNSPHSQMCGVKHYGKPGAANWRPRAVLVAFGATAPCHWRGRIHAWTRRQVVGQAWTRHKRCVSRPRNRWWACHNACLHLSATFPPECARAARVARHRSGPGGGPLVRRSSPLTPPEGRATLPK
jgi:hypothetical protein